MAKRLNISFDEMKEMSYTSLINILISSVPTEQEDATQKDIDSLFR